MNTLSQSRIQSLDLLKGLVMILMLLDHVRYFFHYDAFFFNPMDLSQTTPAIFATRFLTHFCAPVFVFLAGTSAFLVGSQKDKQTLSIWLLKRGLWLVVAELTVIKLAWFFKLDYATIVLQVIWVLGISMICLAGLIHVPKRLVLALSLIVIFGHNALDHFSFTGETGSVIWTFLYEYKIVNVGGADIFIGYQIIPWIFVMPLGYYLGALYLPEVDQLYRVHTLRTLGIGALSMFLFLRIVNVYGDPVPWTVFESWVTTIMSFLNVAKYPASLLFLLVTLGGALLFLSVAERWSGTLHQIITTFGRVPLFFYIVHLYVIHLLASLAAVATGFSFPDMIIDVWVTLQPELKGYGFSLWVVYATWIALTVLLYPLCKWYDAYKRTHRELWWLSYL